jgi:hypothetical protein
MKQIKNLIKEWEARSKSRPLEKTVMIKMTAYDHARIRALSELYPGHSEEQLLAELLSAALDEVEATLPYVPGPKIVAEDEFGDPVFEDSGLTPRFYELTRKYSGE